ncbi:hypothetical protein Nepgr_023865 [Nepenthes gracilis]|uniref:Uncharacterized protein n=1 Tax=Nepenthes gracilis TaxID=150966 RepID=A0AAD3T4P5_NEPGR|nr:hypothetical protein Nepgr_023865 [Nepenthes gracilis]
MEPDSGISLQRFSSRLAIASCGPGSPGGSLLDYVPIFGSRVSGISALRTFSWRRAPIAFFRPILARNVRGGWDWIAPGSLGPSSWHRFPLATFLVVGCWDGYWRSRLQSLLVLSAEYLE